MFRYKQPNRWVGRLISRYPWRTERARRARRTRTTKAPQEWAPRATRSAASPGSRARWGISTLIHLWQLRI